MSGTFFRCSSRALLAALFTLGNFSWAEATPPAAAPSALPNVPAPYSASFQPETTPIPGGAKITAKYHHNSLSSKVSLSLLAVVTDASGNQQLIELNRIDDNFVHSATDYRTERSVDINYDQVNAQLKQLAPQADLKIGPGTRLYLFSRWMNIPSNDPFDRSTWATGSQWNHYYGGISRSGQLILPDPAGTTPPAPGTTPGVPLEKGFTKGGITTALDVAHPIDGNLAAQFPGLTAGGSAGSRFENELKLHVDLHGLRRVENYLTDLAANPAKVESMFGVGWTLKENRKYVGVPMVDIYLDNQLRQGAQIGMALRFRTGSGITSLNYKPDDGQYQGNGSTSRIEYELSGVARPSDIKAFMDSDHPMNALQLIRNKIPGATPSDFGIQVLNLTDERLKFELTAPTGDQVELSLDHVKARQLDPNGQMFGDIAEYGQLEVEVNHLGARGSQDVVPGQGTVQIRDEWSTLHGNARDSFLGALTPGANLQSRIPYQFHGENDFAATSPLKTANASNFALAQGVFDKIRTGIFGAHWNYSGQKYALAAAALGMVPPEQFAPSVKQMLVEREGRDNLTPAEMSTCLASMVKVSRAPAN